MYWVNKYSPCCSYQLLRHLCRQIALSLTEFSQLGKVENLQDPSFNAVWETNLIFFSRKTS